MASDTMTWERITPDKAQLYLTKNLENNRAISMARVNGYMHDMASGNWSNNGTTIKFDKEGHLIDGQHRLTAIVKSGITVYMWVARGVDENAFKTVDIGYARTGTQIIRMESNDPLKRNHTLVPIVRQLFRVYGGNSKPTISQIEECIESNRETLEWYYNTGTRCNSNSSVIYHVLAVVMHVHGVADEQIHSFISAAINGDFDGEKPLKTYKLAVQAERWRRANIRTSSLSVVQKTMLRYAYSFVNNMTNLTRTEEPYTCIMDSKYKLINNERGHE